MKQRLVEWMAVAMAFVLTLTWFVHWEIGAAIRQPAIPLRSIEFGGAEGSVVLAVFAASLHALLLRRLPTWGGTARRARVALAGVSVLSMCALWVLGAYSFAGSYAVYFGNTWEPIEIFMGFVVFSLPAWLMLGAFAALYAAVLHRFARRVT